MAHLRVPGSGQPSSTGRLKAVGKGFHDFYGGPAKQRRQQGRPVSRSFPRGLTGLTLASTVRQQLSSCPTTNTTFTFVPRRPPLENRKRMMRSRARTACTVQAQLLLLFYTAVCCRTLSVHLRRARTRSTLYKQEATRDRGEFSIRRWREIFE